MGSPEVMRSLNNDSEVKLRQPPQTEYKHSTCPDELQPCHPPSHYTQKKQVQRNDTAEFTEASQS